MNTNTKAPSQDAMRELMQRQDIRDAAKAFFAIAASSPPVDGTPIGIQIGDVSVKLDVTRKIHVTCAASLCPEEAVLAADVLLAAAAAADESAF